MTMVQAREMITAMTETEKRAYAQELIKDNAELLENARLSRQSVLDR